MPKIFFLAILLLGFLGCSHRKRTVFASASTSLNPSTPSQVLSQEEAQKRSAAVTDVDYSLFFKVGSEGEFFDGKAEIRFMARETSSPLRVDFADGRLNEVELNGKPIEVAIKEGFFAIPPQTLVAGANVLKVSFRMPYSRTGAGLYRFLDPEDKQTYIYSDFEPFDAHRMFPCFDQPDIKASYRLEADVPESWTVISSTREEKVEALPGQRKLWTFPQSARFSTYIFSLHAGPYKEWSGKAGKIPLRLFARQSLAKHVPHEEWLKVTAQGFSFYEKYFDTAYPFQKYDQVLVPDFNNGAMENVGAVTYSERYLSKGQLTRMQRYEIAEVILHEMAHMWFGDLVTMKWWNDLWLNESFASYMSIVALSQETEFKESWIAFQSGFKQWAYWEDQLVTTHPIEAYVPDTVVAYNTLDGITYGKGASVLKQLAFFLGEANFREGIRNYFKKHAYGSTELKDFMSALSTSSGKDLSKWTQEWLRTAGLNKVRVDFKCRKDQIEHFDILQSPATPEYPVLRSHLARIEIFNLKNNQWNPILSREVTYSGEKTTGKDFTFAPCPELIFPNAGDFDYVKVQLDSRSLEHISGALTSLEDPLLRMMLWQSLWGMVRDADLSVLSYVQTATKALPKEKNPTVIASVIEALSEQVMGYIPARTPEESEMRKKTLAQLESFFWSYLQKSSPGSDRQKAALDGYIDVVESTDGQARLVQLLRGKWALPQFKLDQDRRWNAIIKLHSLDNPEAAALRITELESDASSEGRQSSLAAQVAVPNLDIKRHFWKDLTAKKTPYTLAEIRALTHEFFPLNQETLRAEFAAPFFEMIEAQEDQLPLELLNPLTRHLSPTLCDDMSSSALGSFLEKRPHLNSVVRRQLLINKQENERCTRIRAKTFAS